MKDAVVGTVDNHYVLVIFPTYKHGDVQYYRTQFASDCPPKANFEDDNPSTGGCNISGERITNLTSYYEHKQTVIKGRPTIGQYRGYEFDALHSNINTGEM